MPNEILSELAYDASSGEISYKGVRYILIRPETVVGFQRAAEAANGRAAAEMLYEGGKIGGRLSSETYSQKFGCTPAETVEFMARMGSNIGWGSMQVEALDLEGGFMKLRVDNSAFARAYGQSDSGVCHLIRGVFAGVAQAVFGRDVDSVEKSCIACGDPACIFEYHAMRRPTYTPCSRRSRPSDDVIS